MRKRWKLVFGAAAALAACGDGRDEGPRRYRGGPSRPVPSTPTRLPPRDADGPIGTAHPTLLVSAAADGRWAVVCQARVDDDGRPGIGVHVGLHGDLAGDSMRPYLVRGAGEGVALDQFVTASPDDRWLVVVRDQRLILVDDDRGEELVLAGGDGSGDRTLLAHRAAAFDRASEHVAYFRGRTVVLRSLRSGEERQIAVPRGIPWRIQIVGETSWQRLLVIERDSNGDGKLGFPEQMTSAPLDEPCVGPAMSWSTYGRDGDAPTAAWIDFASGDVIFDRHALLPLGDDFLRKDASKAIVYKGAVVVPAACDAFVVAASLDPLRVAAACRDSGRRSPVKLYGGASPVEMCDEVEWRDESFPAQVTGNRVCDYRRCVALDGRVVAFDGVLRTLHEGKALVERDAGPFELVDLESGARTPVPVAGDHIRAEREGMVVVGKLVVDLARGAVVGSVTGEAIAVDRTGRVMQAAGAGDGRVPMGPLRWEAAAAPPVTP